ncbi:Kunitz/Bovine pancreatic trypsin inhibitor domain protein [Ancylostoma ceylanicum]|uniref:Kunitz/Bovine pancreatic trypsin inhibitor domain protein n=1 Tax=Ancylostoma ceylanicum TaxID=53326 RepID=A0A0D6LST3_9BILA|nr:Kunitz/Bovine pancreatic trypsin inhibitor domain protein [Ancylostoma ceylanicum]
MLSGHSAMAQNTAIDSLHGEDRCSQPIRTGPCRAAFRRYAFDKNIQQCVPFVYGGCGGNDNNFKTMRNCMDACEDVNDMVSKMADASDSDTVDVVEISTILVADTVANKLALNTYRAPLSTSGEYSEMSVVTNK